MAHNTALNLGAGGNTLADYDLSLSTAYPTTGHIGLGAIYVGADASSTPTPVTPANPFPVASQPSAVATGGSTPHNLLSAATTNATSVKNAAGTLYGFTLSNVNAAARFVKFYDKASAPTVGSDTPTYVVFLAPSTGVVTHSFPVGLKFALGIAYAITGLVATSDTTAVGAGDVLVNLNYK